MITNGIIPQSQTLLGKITQGKSTQGKTTQGKITQEDYPWYYTPNSDNIEKVNPGKITKGKKRMVELPRIKLLWVGLLRARLAQIEILMVIL